ncbi:MAG: ABC transporter ATP-binding protein [Acidobacteriota bacterium]|nr:ABC transporter ATP-binding protein [Acidobacteriota bacterium]
MTEASQKTETLSQPPRVLLRTRGLQKRFGNYEVLRGLDLCVREGSVYGFLGRNGAGKTTTIQILMGIQKSNQGVIDLFGRTAKRPNIAEKRRIGYVSQEQHFYPWMSCRYLGKFVSRFYPTWDQPWFLRLLHTFELPMDRKVINLSQGMKVKLALALALAHRPRILILDEPTSGLDPAARREFLDIVSHQAETEGRTTFFSSHIVEEVARIADHVGIIDRGKLCFQGRPDTLYAGIRGYRPQDPEVWREPARKQALVDRLKAQNLTLLAEEPRQSTLVLEGDSEAWSGVDSHTLTLEDIFLALTTKRIQLA